MNFLFSSTIQLDGGGKCIYKIFQFKLFPTRYKAELIDGNCAPEIVLWRENDGWKTFRQTREVKLLAAMLGQEINRAKN